MSNTDNSSYVASVNDPALSRHRVPGPLAGEKLRL